MQQICYKFFLNVMHCLKEFDQESNRTLDSDGLIFPMLQDLTRALKFRSMWNTFESKLITEPNGAFSHTAKTIAIYFLFLCFMVQKLSKLLPLNIQNFHHCQLLWSFVAESDSDVSIFNLWIYHLFCTHICLEYYTYAYVIFG